MMKDTFTFSQWYTGSSFQATFIIECLSGMYLEFQRIVLFYSLSLYDFLFVEIHKDLSTQRQEDAHEFLCYLIENMERSYLSASGYADDSYVV